MRPRNWGFPKSATGSPQPRRRMLAGMEATERPAYAGRDTLAVEDARPPVLALR